jgi:nucleoside transporter
MDLSVDSGTYIRLSAVMFLQYAVWGAWAPVLAARLLGPLKMTGKQTGWIYATLPIACIVSPLVSGLLADKYMNTEWVLAISHALGAVLLFLAVRQQTFKGLFLVMLLYSLCYGATLPLANAVLFAHVSDLNTQGLVFIWAPIAWALVGYFLTGWRTVRGGEGDGSDCLMLAAVLSVLMAVACYLAPATPPKGATEIPIIKAFGMLAQPDFLVFILVSLVVGGLMQFYFLGSARFMIDMGISGKNVPATMGIAQAAQAVATFFLLGIMVETVGFKWALTIGAGFWLLMYLVYVGTKPRWLIVLSQTFHGLAYVFFMIVGQIFAGKVGPHIPASMQALIFAATSGVGLFLGTQLAGIVMDRFSVEGQFQWRKIWAVPMVIMAAGTLVLATVFQAQLPAPDAAPAAEQAAAEIRVSAS